MDMKKDEIVYSIVVPVYNSEQTLGLLYQRLVQVMEELGEVFEIVFVEDSGKDNSWQVVQSLAEKDQRVSAIRLMRNYGQSNATMCGLRHSRGRFLITIDDDLQNPPEEIPVLIEALEQRPDIDVIMGAPRQKQHALWRRLGSRFVNQVSNYILNQDPSLKLTSFRIMRRSVVEHLLAVNTPRPAPGAILCTITPRVTNVYVRHEPRVAGKGGYTLAKILGLTLDKTLSFSTLPLRFLAIVGLIGIIASALIGTFFLTRYLVGGIKVVGWTTLVLLLVTLSGFNFFAFGIVGEYLLRILQTIHGTPQYLVRQRVGWLDAEMSDASNLDLWGPKIITSADNDHSQIELE